MGNCTSGKKKKNKENSSSDSTNNGDNKPGEDVMYASIDHTTAKGSRESRATTDNDCDYATVNLPATLESECSSKDECTDDYVLMG
ncbi:hypothetical protein Q5P01_013649 [Channa striata]|uniref:Uncharacterized protein n=1 Tax=Channa striata TaxID=64152 RepID=A0AA88SKL0_CHASR|nr:hypothetical protein Q5P01_013649 [Channa striata]